MAEAPRITFFVEIKPAAFSRSTAVMSSRIPGKRGRIPEHIVTFRNAIWIEYLAATRTPPVLAPYPLDGSYVGRVGMVIDIYGSAADILNVGKEVEDALIGGAYRDDCQVVESLVRAPSRILTDEGGIKRHRAGERQGVEVTLVFLDGLT